MRLLRIFTMCSTLLLGACASSDVLRGVQVIANQSMTQSGGVLSAADIARGLKQALSVSSDIVVDQLSQTGGYTSDPVIRVPLPTALVRAKRVAAKVGLDGNFDALENRLNMAAELAAGNARSLFAGAIRQMTLNDARAILDGPDDAATQFFKRTMGPQLSASMRPVIEDSLSQVGAVRSFNQVLARYRQIPFAPAVEADLTGHVLQAGMDGIWHYIALEEQAIRENPVKRTTALLRRVFGGI